MQYFISLALASGREQLYHWQWNIVLRHTLHHLAFLALGWSAGKRAVIIASSVVREVMLTAGSSLLEQQMSSHSQRLEQVNLEQ